MHGERASGSHAANGAGRRRPDVAATLAPDDGSGPEAEPARRLRGPDGPGNLPAALTSFVGRERELAELGRLLEAQRLVTLVGPPGVGKTRLALRLAEEARGRFADGAWLVELAPLADPRSALVPALVPQAVAAALGVREEPGRPLIGALLAALGPRHLLVLDNCEHLVEACAELAVEILRACRRVRILATSREVLAVAGEATWAVPSLSLPDPDRPPPPERLAESEAVRLFGERVGLVAPGFAVTGANAAAVAEVCRRLDGIPLALELAAARVKILSPEQIAARLDDRFRLLTAGSRTALPRQRTLRGAIDWSHGLLPGPERVLLRRLAVFAGGWTIEAAETVCSGDGIAADDVLDLLAQLVGKSLVLAEDRGGEMRYRLLETLRQYADEELRGAGEETLLRGRHCAWFLDLAERAEPGLVGPEQAAWLEGLEREHDNLRGALRWAVDHGEAETGLRLGAALWRFWWVHGHLSEGRRWLEAALAQGAGAPPTARAKALNAAGNLALARGEYEPARAFLEESLALWRGLGDQGSTATALYSLGRVAHRTGDHAAARALTEESLALRRALNDRWGMAVSLNMLGEIARAQGDYAAGPLYEEGIGLFRAAGDTRGVAIATHNLGIVARAQVDHERAAALHHAALALFHELGDREQIACSLIKLAHLALIQGDSERAAL
jgi:non-specific serine/threonine protein kinase